MLIVGLPGMFETLDISFGTEEGEELGGGRREGEEGVNKKERIGCQSVRFNPCSRA